MDFWEYRASKVKPKPSYPDSKMRVWNKPEPVTPDKAIEVEETDASPSMVLRIIKAFKGE